MDTTIASSHGKSMPRIDTFALIEARVPDGSGIKLRLFELDQGMNVMLDGECVVSNRALDWLIFYIRQDLKGEILTVVCECFECANRAPDVKHCIHCGTHGNILEPWELLLKNEEFYSFES